MPVHWTDETPKRAADPKTTRPTVDTSVASPPVKAVLASGSGSGQISSGPVAVHKEQQRRMVSELHGLMTQVVGENG